MFPITYSFELVTNIMQRLTQTNIAVGLCGGWAEEIWRLREAGLHKDIDLLYPASDFVNFDRWSVVQNDLTPIPGKHFSHKRAFLYQGIMVELILFQPVAGGYITDFFEGRYCFHWPVDTLQQLETTTTTILITNPQVLRLYRLQHHHIEAAYSAYHQQVQDNP